MKSLLASLLFVSSAFFAAPDARAGSPQVELLTSAGRIVITLDAEKAPLSTENFLTYVRENQYDATVFHRVIDGFMIQGGGFDADLRARPTRAPIQNEARNGLKNEVGTIAMARTNDPHSATSQFFINLVDNVMLDYPSRDGWGYAVFGRVTEGLDVVHKIGKVATRTMRGHQNVPVEAIVVSAARILPQGATEAAPVVQSAETAQTPAVAAPPNNEVAAPAPAVAPAQ